MIPTVLLAVVVGALGGWWLARSRAAAQLAELRADVADRDATVAEVRAGVAEARAEVATVTARLARAEGERDAALQRAREVTADRESLQAQFRALSAEQLAQQRQQTAQDLVAPVAEGLKVLQERIEAVERERVRMTAELRTHVAAVQSSGEALRLETRGLSNALRTPQVRGSWGEQSLRRMVEVSGLTERVDFDEQPQATASDGNAQRPDMVVHLAGGKEIFVDSKVPLAALLEAYNTDDEAQQQRHLDDFARHVRKHVDALADKRYWDLSLASPEFVVLYLGSDESYRLAQERIPDLHDYAARRRVMLASPGILIPMLHIVAHGWTQESLAESAAKVVELGRELHRRLATMGTHFAAAGRGLTQAVTNYNKAIASLESRVLVQARRFGELTGTGAELAELGPVEVVPNAPSAPELTAAQQVPTTPSAPEPEAAQEVPTVGE